MEENYDLENDFKTESLILFKKLKRRTIIVLVFFIITIVSSMFVKYSDFDVIFTSLFFKVLITLSVIMTIVNISLCFFKDHFNKEHIFKLIKREKEAYELISVIPIFVAVVVFLNAFLLSPAVVEGPSMEPNYYEGDTVIISHLNNYERFDTVIIKVVSGDTYSYYIKRIIGLPGETVTIENNSIYITRDGETFLLDDTTEIPNNAVTTCLPGTGQDISDSCSFIVPEGEYFVLGDNRQQSTDSRTPSLGTIEEESFYGEVIFRVNFFD